MGQSPMHSVFGYVREENGRQAKEKRKNEEGNICRLLLFILFFFFFNSFCNFRLSRIDGKFPLLK